MLGIVVTGGSNGVGWAYANELIARKHSVVICDIQDPSTAVLALQNQHPDAQIFGIQCDVG